MFERFTDRARRFRQAQQHEARELNHDLIGTEHILLGLAREGDGLAAKSLDALGVTCDAIREKVKELPKSAHGTSSNSPSFTPRAKKVLELSLREALQLGHSYIGTEHLLLGLLRQGDDSAVRVLNELGLEVVDIRSQVVQLMSGLSSREIGERAVDVPLDGAVFRGVVRAVGQRLRPDLESTDLDERAGKIADDLFHQLRRRWNEPGPVS